jgi:hypothetical protein
MDEYVGTRRLRMRAIILEAVPGRRLVWQLKKAIKLPVRLSLELEDYEGGVAITHTVHAGLRGAGAIADPLIRLFFSTAFTAALDDHVKTEFPMLRGRREQVKAEVGAR